MGKDHSLDQALTDARTISNAWGRRIPRLADEFASACNLAIVQAMRVETPTDFDGLCRCIMHRRCRDVYRFYIRDRGRERPLLIKWAEEWATHVGEIGDGYAYYDYAHDAYEMDETPWLWAQFLDALADVESQGLAKPRSVLAVRLWLELREQRLAAERLGVTPSRVAQMVREVTDAIKGLKVGV